MLDELIKNIPNYKWANKHNKKKQKRKQRKGKQNAN